jgi:cytochrome c-type biogenesis protein CcmH
MRKATRLEPKQAGLWADLGILLLMQGQGEETAPSGEAFRKALSLDPQNAAARYHLARARIAAGDVDGGLAGWRALLADLPSGAAERQALQQEIDATAKAGHLIAPPPAQPTPAPQQPAQAAPGGDQKAFILSMVQRLAEQLRQDPNDPAGWARLIRSYAVLGEADKMRQAQDQARRQFKGQPDVLKTLDNAASAPQGSQ